MNVAELLDNIQYLLDQKLITLKSPILVSGDEEGNTYGSIFSIHGKDGQGVRTKSKDLIDHAFSEDIPEGIWDKCLTIYPLT